MSRKLKHIFLLCLALYAVSCSVTRHVPAGEYLLQEVVVHPDHSVEKEQMISAVDLDRYIRQTPNRRFFGLNFYVWAYYSADPENANWWNNLKRKIGEEPIYFNEELAKKSLDNLNIYMDSEGFYASSAGYIVDTLTRRRRAKVIYNVKQGVPYTIGKLSTEFRDSSLRNIILADSAKTLLDSGAVFGVSLLDRERERIATDLRNEGYYDFTVRNIEYEADTLVGNNVADVKMIINPNIAGYSSRGEPNYVENSRYRIASVNIMPNFDPKILQMRQMDEDDFDYSTYQGINIVHEKGTKPNLRPQVARQIIPFDVGDLYRSSKVEQAYDNLMSLGYFKSARITFEPTPLDSIIHNANLMRIIEARRDYKRGEWSVDTLAENQFKYLNANILATPALRQSYNIEMDVSTTSSFYGVYTTVGYQNRNIFRGAEAWDVQMMLGYENMKAPDAPKSNAIEFGVSTGLSFPRFIAPFAKSLFSGAQRPQTRAEIMMTWQDRPYYERTLSSARWSYLWRNKSNSSFTFSPVSINMINMSSISEVYLNSLNNDYLRNSYQTQLVAGVDVSYVFNNQLDRIGRDATVLQINAESAGNTIRAIGDMLGTDKSADNYYEFLGIRYAQYARADLSIAHRIMLSPKYSIAGRLFAGAGVAYGNSTALPFDRLFYSGGNNSMRGWAPRTLGPGSSVTPEDDLYPSRVGDMKLEANVEFRFPIWNIVGGATFLDLGNVWYLQNSEGIYNEDEVFNSKTFYKQLGFNTGFGLRFDIQFAILRLDWGIQLYNPNVPQTQDNWVIKNFNFDNTAVNFGVGYPF